jgi:hypothetical protein
MAITLYSNSRGYLQSKVITEILDPFRHETQDSHNRAETPGPREAAGE